MTNTGIDPWAMVVHLHNATAAATAVMRTWRLKPLTRGAELQHLLVLGILWLPTKGCKARAMVHGMHVIDAEKEDIAKEQNIVHGTTGRSP